MKQRISEDVKIDVGLVAQALNNTNATGKYHRFDTSRRIVAILSVAAMAATKTAKVELLQASDASGTGAKGIPTTAGQLATAQITANTLVTEMTLTLATVLAADTVTINGVTFTAHATVTTAANREFSISGTDTADAAELVSLINNATYGVSGVTASNAAGVITLVSTDPGETLITASSTGGTITIATTKAQAFVEIDGRQLDKDDDFSHIAAKVTTTANTVVAVVLLRGNERFSPVQKVGASAVV